MSYTTSKHIGLRQLQHPQHNGMGLFGHAELFEGIILVMRLRACEFGMRYIEPADEEEVA